MTSIPHITNIYKYISNTVSSYILKLVEDDETDEDDVTDENTLERNSISAPIQQSINRTDYCHDVRNSRINDISISIEEQLEKRDHFDEYTKLITVTDRSLYKYNNNIVKSVVKRTQSCNMKRYYCGFCSQLIYVPELMYNDNPYCTVTCRNKKILEDKNNNNKVREHHSFSI